jgi:hypothetical protein
MLKKVTIFGERCSGTNYLENLLTSNFDIEFTWSYGWKHFFGFTNLKDSDDVLFIGIVRNLTDWINSLYKNPHHLPPELIQNIQTFCDNEFYSIYEDNNEIMEDRNIDTNERYKNIFELRHIKNKFLVEKMPTLVKNYCLITYDDLINKFDDIMQKIKNYNLPIKNNIEFPINIYYYKKDVDIKFEKYYDLKINSKSIISKANLHYEKILFPDLDFDNLRM